MNRLPRWLIVALAVGLLATFLAFRHWDALTVGVRWLALSPVAIISVLLLLAGGLALMFTLKPTTGERGTLAEQGG